MQAHCLHLFHVIHTHEHIILPDPSPKDLTSILMKSLIKILNTKLPSLLRDCSYSHDTHVESLTNIIITMSPFPFDNNQKEGNISSTTIKLFNNLEIPFGKFNSAQGNKTSYQASFSCLKPFLVNRPFYQGNPFLDSLSLLLEHMKPHLIWIPSTSGLLE
jgi:hypothetical protein